MPKKKIVLDKEQLQNLQKFLLFFNSILILVGVLHIHYNIKSHAWVHITIMVLFPPYIVVYFLLIFFKCVNITKNE